MMSSEFGTSMGSKFKIETLNWIANLKVCLKLWLISRIRSMLLLTILASLEITIHHKAIKHMVVTITGISRLHQRLMKLRKSNFYLNP